MQPEIDAAEFVGQSQSSSSAASQPTSVGIAMVRTLILALVAGGIVAAIVMVAFPIFEVPAELMASYLPPAIPPPEIAMAHKASVLQCRMLNAIMFLGSLGFFTSLLLGAGEVAIRRFSGVTIVRLVVGVVFATLVAVLGAALGQFLTQQLLVATFSVPMTRTFLAQACMLVLYGAGIAAALGLVAGGVRAAGANVVAGVMAGIVVAFLFPVLCSFVLPHLDTEVAIPGLGAVGPAEKHILGLALYIGVIALVLAVLIPLGNRRKT